MLLRNGGDRYFNAAIQRHARRHPEWIRSPGRFSFLREPYSFSLAALGSMSTRSSSQKSSFPSPPPSPAPRSEAKPSRRTALCSPPLEKRQPPHHRACFFHTSLQQTDPHQPTPAPCKHHTRAHTQINVGRRARGVKYYRVEDRKTWVARRALRN